MVVHYNIYDKNYKSVGTHRQNYMCLICNDGLEKYQPYTDFYIVSYEDENDIDIDDYQTVENFLKSNKGEFTFKIPNVGDIITIKKYGEGLVTEIIKGKFNNSYMIKLPSGEELKIEQRQIKPNI